MSQTIPVQRVVLIAEAAAAEALLQIVERLKFEAYSIVDCSGRGSRAIMANPLSGPSHVQLEAWGSESAVETLVRTVKESIKKRYSVVCISEPASASLATNGSC
jgi:hypothetical protein